MGNSDENFVLGLVTITIGAILGAGLYWLVTTPYMPEFFPAMAHGLYALGMLILTIGFIVVGFKIDGKYALLLFAVWLMLVGFWIISAYVIYDIITGFLLWWGSNFAENSAAILFIIAIMVMVIWAIDFILDEREAKRIRNMRNEKR